MGRSLAGAVAALALLWPAAIAGMHGDDWDGTFAVASPGQVFLYTFEGRGCGFPMWCWSLAERFFVGGEGGLVEVPGTAAWTATGWGAANSYVRVHGALDFGGQPVEVVWFALVHSICHGTYEGPVFLVPLDQAGRGGARKVGPGPDGFYECMPS